MTEQYRLDTAYGKLYEWDKESKAYVFVSSTDCKNIDDAAREYEEHMDAQECQ